MSDSGTTGVLYALATGGAISLVCTIIFEVLRHRIPSVYEYRNELHKRRTSHGYFDERIQVAEPPSSALFGWIRSVLQLDLAKLEETHGLDVAFLVRFLRSKVHLFSILTLLCCVILVPVYFTGPHKSFGADEPLQTRGLQRFTLSNVDPEDPWRFWVAFTVQALVTTATFASLYMDYCAYHASRVRYRSSKSPANYAVLVQDIPSDSATPADVKDYWSGLMPVVEIVGVYRAHNAKKIDKNMMQFWAAVTNREKAEWMQQNDKKLNGQRPQHKPGMLGFLKKESAVVDSIDYWTAEQEKLHQKITTGQKDFKKCCPLQSSIVVFKTKRSASIASQAMFAQSYKAWHVSRAPEPLAINWSALAIPRYQTDVRSFITTVAILALTLLWIVPVTFVQGLANLESLSEFNFGGRTPFRFLSGIQRWSPRLTGFVEGLLPPIIHAVFLSLIPVFLRLLVGISRIPSKGKAEAIVRNWFFEFLFFNSFLFVVLSGSILEQLPLLRDMIRNSDLNGFANVLANSVPTRGTFFMVLIIIKSTTACALLLLQAPRVIIRFIMRKFIAKTERQLAKVDKGGTVNLYFRFYAVAQLVTMLGVIYSTLSPFVVPCCLLYFCTNYVVLTYNVTYTTLDEYHDGGSMFPGSMTGVVVAVVMQQITMLGVFALNGRSVLSTLSLILAVLAVVFYFFTHRYFPSYSEHGSIMHAQMQDTEKANQRYIPPHVVAKYKQPALEALHTFIPPLDETATAYKQESKTTKDTFPDIESGVKAVNDNFIEPLPSGRNVNAGPKSGNEVWLDARTGSK